MRPTRPTRPIPRVIDLFRRTALNKLPEMVVGLLSDTHGRVEATRQALSLLRDARVDCYLHGGDIGGENILDLLAGLHVDCVWGNCDDRDRLSRYARSLNIKVHHPFAELSLDGKSLAVIHGDDTRQLEKLLRDGGYDYVISGHTHVAHDRNVGRTRWINPGAIHRASRPSVATLDLSQDLLQVIPLN